MATSYKHVDKDQLRNARAAVARGVELLNREGPGDWRSRITQPLLDMASTTSCILGQTFSAQFAENETGEPGYDIGVQELVDGTGYQSSFYGFDSSDGADEPEEGFFGYAALGLAWEEELWPEMFTVTAFELEERFEQFRQELPGFIASGIREVFRNL